MRLEPQEGIMSFGEQFGGQIRRLTALVAGTASAGRATRGMRPGFRPQLWLATLRDSRRRASNWRDIADVMHRPGYTLVVPQGHLGAATAPQLRTSLTGLLAVHSPLVIDLDQVAFLGAEGFGVLMGTVRRARAAGVSLRLICRNRHTRRLLQQTGLASHLPLACTLDEALAELVSRPAADGGQGSRARRHGHLGSRARLGHGLA
jgi:anti-sigma B factor antagonist